METCCGVRYGLPPRNAGALGRHLDSRGIINNRLYYYYYYSFPRPAAAAAAPFRHWQYSSSGPPPRTDRSRFGLRRSTSHEPRAPLPFFFFYFLSLVCSFWVGTGGGLPYPPFQGPAVAHGTPSAYLRGALRRTGGDRNSEDCSQQITISRMAVTANDPHSK